MTNHDIYIIFFITLTSVLNIIVTKSIAVPYWFIIISFFWFNKSSHVSDYFVFIAFFFLNLKRFFKFKIFNHDFFICILFYSCKELGFFRPFQQRCAITDACAHTYAKVFWTVINPMCISNFWLHVFNYIIAGVWSKYVLILMLLLNIQLLLIIKLKLHSEVFWLWKLSILHRNQKGFLFSPVYKC